MLPFIFLQPESDVDLNKVPFHLISAGQVNDSKSAAGWNNIPNALAFLIYGYESFEQANFFESSAIFYMMELLADEHMWSYDDAGRLGSFAFNVGDKDHPHDMICVFPLYDGVILGETVAGTMEATYVDPVVKNFFAGL